MYMYVYRNMYVIYVCIQKDGPDRYRKIDRKIENIDMRTDRFDRYRYRCSCHTIYTQLCVYMQALLLTNLATVLGHFMLSSWTT